MLDSDPRMEKGSQEGASYWALLFSFSRMRSTGFPVIVGGLGVGPVFAGRGAVWRRLSSSCRRNSVPMGKVAKGVIFGGFTYGVALSRVAGVALCDMWTSSLMWRKSFRVARTILLRLFQNMS